MALAVLGAFAAWELHSDHPMLNVEFFKNPRFTAASQAVTLVFFALFGSLFVVTQYLQSVLGYSALAAGVRILPFAVVMMVLAPQSAKVAERFGTKLVVSGGLVVVAVGLLVLFTATADLGLPAGVRVVRDHGHGHGLHHGAGHRVDHGLAAP